ncbi:EAL domain-containing protein [Maritalea sp.]|uniref:EAL domain-containing protein n=1 Tax=Maritalea sp. TaxID=2003361 RepID=UPI003EF8A000
MRAIVLFFVAVACLSIGVTAYFALGFTLIEAFLVTIVAFLASFVLVEALFRRRTETYLAQQTEEIARQLSTIAKTTELVSDQVSFLSSLNMKDRADDLEADVSVLGTVVRQLAEAVAEMEELQSKPAQSVNAAPAKTQNSSETGSGGFEVVHGDQPAISIDTVKYALANNQIEQYLQPIVTLPQRRTLGYELMPKLYTDDGVLHHAEDFLHYEDQTGTISELEQFLLRQATNIIHRSNMTGEPTTLFVPSSKALLSDQQACDSISATLTTNRAVAVSLVLQMPESLYESLNSAERQSLAELVKNGAGICLENVRSLRLSFQQLSERGVRYVKADAARFIEDPLNYTDFHRADLADYVERFGIGLIMSNVTSEDQVLELLDDKIPLAQGRHIAAASPVRPDLTGEKSSGRRAAR